MSTVDSKITIEVRIYHAQQKITFHFPSIQQAQSFSRLVVLQVNVGAVGRKERSVEVPLPLPPGLEYMRAGAGTPSMIFGFEKEDDAKMWLLSSVLGERDGKEVRIKLKWSPKELEKILSSKAAQTKIEKDKDELERILKSKANEAKKEAVYEGMPPPLRNPRQVGEKGRPRSSDDRLRRALGEEWIDMRQAILESGDRYEDTEVRAQGTRERREAVYRYEVRQERPNMLERGEYFERPRRDRERRERRLSRRRAISDDDEEGPRHARASRTDSTRPREYIY